MSTRVIKGAYRDAVKRAKSFRELKKKGKAYTDKPEIRRVTITYSDWQDWRIEDGVIKLRTHASWLSFTIIITSSCTGISTAGGS